MSVSRFVLGSRHEARAMRRWFTSRPWPAQDLISGIIEHNAEFGRQAVNAALAVAGSSRKYTVSDDANGSAVAAKEPHPHEQRQTKSLFWSPYAPGSPFRIGREKYIAQHLAKSADSKSLIPDKDVEIYVDFLLSKAILSNVSLPFGAGRQLYIRVVRIVQRVILNTVSLVEGEVLGKELCLLKMPSEVSFFRRSEAQEVDHRIVRLLVRRTLDDHMLDGVDVAPYFSELGLPRSLVENLYEDILKLTLRLVMDVTFTFQIRCLGHSLTCTLTPDDMLHTAPGWDVALEEGAFGIFDDKEKRRWVQLFVDDLLCDEAIRMRELPEAVQRQMYTRVSLVLLSLCETAMNHFRLHVAGMAFRPALKDAN
eukprot:TRINITY_DN28861_c0_g1_i1.p1 TRINITY_DN28861_c0_g1~~TRINITY_DN28861_c0_g1_i1.p1  ORF type:complete len:367 (+),score=45.19 TRINITY_DN28861_c0_g1_i1:59-1159(+)